jgi:hypothetical protein
MKSLQQKPQDRINPASRHRRQDRTAEPAHDTIPQGQNPSHLPSGPRARSLRQTVVRQIQQSQGNAAVQRALLDRVDRQPEEPPTSTAPTPAPEPAAEPGATPTELSSGGSSVRVTPGTVDISGGMVNVNAAFTRAAGVLQADTLIANTVVGSTYTPGAGNVY